MTVKEHYDNHLGDIYSWMTGNFQIKQKEFEQFLSEHNIIPTSTKIAIDLGAGHGIQAVSIAKRGYDVKAVDFNTQLLDELAINSAGLAVEIIDDDIRNVKRFTDSRPELIVCCGDTLTHLDNIEEIRTLLSDCAEILADNGKLILTFREYSTELHGDNRFIPVKSDDTKIFICCLDYEPIRVRVTDILYYKTDNGWKMKVSSYYKVRVAPQAIVDIVSEEGLIIDFNGVVNSMVAVIVRK
ncbi:MAG: class I SAM-dependent methyltransferase [Ignavibacteriae bacterium]|nr:class I SAM-dependent methyltransferase [Ignavibacteriota bacterium]